MFDCIYKKSMRMVVDVKYILSIHTYIYKVYYCSDKFLFFKFSLNVVIIVEVKRDYKIILEQHVAHCYCLILISQSNSIRIESFESYTN